MYRIKFATLSLFAFSFCWADNTQRASQLRAEAEHYRDVAARQPAATGKQPMAPGSREHNLWLASRLEAEASRLDGKPARTVETACCANCCPRTERNQPCAD